MEIFITSAVRTAVGSFGGALKDVSAVELGALAIASAVKRAGVDKQDIDEVIMGNVIQAGLGQNPARQSAVKAGIPVKVPAMTINKLCGSGLKAVVLGAQAIVSGDAEVVVAGGMENMSQSPFLLKNARWGYKMGNNDLIDAMMLDGLWDAFGNCHMGLIAEGLAQKYGISREEQDEFAYKSQIKTASAIKEGKFREEIAPVNIVCGKSEKVNFDTDEFPKPATTVEILSKLKPAFKKDGTITAGNASGINDGASAVVVVSEKKLKEMKLKPVCRMIAWSSVGVEPEMFGLGPVMAVREVLKKTNLKLSDIDLIESNEAFAVQSIAVGKELEWDWDKVNVNGGAIALGHPIGASGARILVTLLHELSRRNSRYGLATLCIGGGQGMAMVVERVGYAS